MLLGLQVIPPLTPRAGKPLAQAVLGGRQSPGQRPEGSVCYHTNTQSVGTAALETMCFIWTLPLGCRKAANCVVWYKAMAKGSP